MHRCTGKPMCARVAPAVASGRNLQPASGPGRNPDARAAMRLAVSKSRVEAPLLAKITPRDFAAAVDRTVAAADDATSAEACFAAHRRCGGPDLSSIALIRSQNPEAYRDAGALEKTLRQLQQTIALDTVHNNYQFRRRILGHGCARSPGQAVRGRPENRRVYALNCF